MSDFDNFLSTLAEISVVLLYIFYIVAALNVKMLPLYCLMNIIGLTVLLNK